MNKNISVKLIFIILLSSISCSKVHSEETLSVWAMGEEGIRLKHVAKDFEKEHPGVKVNIQTIPWGAANEKLTTSIVGELPPDVSQMGTTWMAKFAAMKAFEPLTKYIESSAILKKENFFDGSWNTCVYKNNLYGIPWYVDTRVLFYRSDLLNEVGYDNAPKNLDELIDAGIKIKNLSIDINGNGKIDEKDKHYPLNLPVTDPGALNYSTFVWQNNGNFLTDDGTQSLVLKKETKEALQFYLRLFQEGICGVRASQDIKLEMAFRSGYFAMFIGGTWMINNLNKYVPGLSGKWNVSLVPGKHEHTSFVGGCNWVIFRNSQKKDLAWKWIEFMSRPDIQVNWFKIADSLPSVKKAWKDPYFKERPMLQVFGKQLEFVQSPPVTEDWDELAQNISQVMEKILYSLEKKPTEGIEKLLDPFFIEMDNKLNKVLNKTVYQQTIAFKISVACVIVFSLIGMLVFWFSKKKTIDELKVVPTESLLETSKSSIFLFLTPAIVILAVFLFLPVIISLVLSLTNWNVKGINDINQIVFIGFDNYKDLLKDEVFWKSVLNTFIFAFVGVPFTIITSMIFALILSQKLFKGIGFFRTSLFLPVVTTMVAVAVIWRWFYNPQYGIVNWILSLIQLPPQDWLGHPKLALPSLILMATWKNFGYNMVIFIAGLQGIPHYLYEAADIDGATPLQKFYYVTLPLLKPVTVFITVITTIGYFQFFAEPYVMTKGGPLNATISVVLYMYNHAFKYFNLGYASAIAYVLALIIISFSLFQIWLGKRNPV